LQSGEILRKKIGWLPLALLQAPLDARGSSPWQLPCQCLPNEALQVLLAFQCEVEASRWRLHNTMGNRSHYWLASIVAAAPGTGSG